MANLKKIRPGEEITDAQMDTTVQIMNTVKSQIEMYATALRKIQLMREEIKEDKNLLEKIAAGPESMMEVLECRGIPKVISAGMTAEEFKRVDFPGGELAVWTIGCCCSACCYTCHNTSSQESVYEPGVSFAQKNESNLGEQTGNFRRHKTK